MPATFSEWSELALLLHLGDASLVLLELGPQGRQLLSSRLSHLFSTETGSKVHPGGDKNRQGTGWRKHVDLVHAL